MKGGFAAFKVKDIDEVQDLVTAHVESLEPGLRILDARVLLGDTTIDLVAMDKDAQLVLMTLGFEADDEMLVRTLDAYSWCLESPEALRRLYPSARLSPADPPRLLVVAERVSDAFLRKLRHLRVQRIDCLEFSIGLRFEHVGVVRTKEPAPASPPKAGLEPRRVEAPAPPRVRAGGEPPRAPEPQRVADPARAPEPPAAAAAGRRDAPEAPAPPPPGGTAAARWRRMLAEGGPVDEWKVKIVRDYLQREFPTSVIYDFYAHDRSGQMFHLQDSYGDVIHAVCVAEQFLQVLAEPEVRAFFDTHKLGRVLRQAGQAQVSVTSSGVRIERT